MDLCQAEIMARGWESKSVEAQIESAEERVSQARRPHLSADELAREKERESIELSRTRVVQDLASASNPKYKRMLERSLEFLDGKLAKLQG